MHLTSEQRQIGEDNFHQVVGDTRRDFLMQSLTALAVPTTGLGAMYFGYGGTVESPVRVGIIGTGDEGNVLIGALNPDYVQVVAIADIRPYNVHRAFHGDFYSPNAVKARPGLMAKYDWKTEDEARGNIKVYTDGYEELLKDPAVEAVIIALPLHLHDAAAIQAMRAGKDVLTEKLMAHSVHQCKEMARVAQETGLYLATGHQRHYSILYDNAVHTIQQGLIGDIHHIRAQWHRGNLPDKDSWQPDLPESKNLLSKLASWERRLTELKRARTPKHSEIELWEKRVAQVKQQIEDKIVDAARHGYEEKTLDNGYERSALEELIRWRLWDRTGGGLMAELGSHQLDASGIFITAQHTHGHKVAPLSVVGVAGRHIFPLDRDVDDHVYCMFEYPGPGYYKDYEKAELDDPNKKIVVTYSSINGNGYGGYGEIVMGTNGTLILEREQEVMLFKGAATSTRLQVGTSRSGEPTLDTTESGPGQAAAVAKAATGPVSRGYREEIEHWAWCIRNRDPENKPRCHPEVALSDAVIALTTNMATKKAQRYDFKREWFDINSDETPEGVAPRKV